MDADLNLQEGDLASVLSAAETILPGKGLYPDPLIPGAVRKAKAVDVARFLSRDAHEGLAPFDRPFRWRVLSRPVDSRARGCGRAGVAPGYCVAAPLSVIAANSAGAPPKETEEPYGRVTVGVRDAWVVAHQARAAYLSAMGSSVRGGGVWG